MNAAAADTGPVYAAGTLPWRRSGDDVEVALVHRPRYDDWSWPKGKLEEAESWPAAAVRETREETGLTVRLGLPLPQAFYTPIGTDTPKVVRYWAAQVIGDAGRLDHEVDDVAWLTPDRARERLTHDRDEDQLDAFVGAHAAGTLPAAAFGVVRHAHAVPRTRWDDDDRLRPLDDRGHAQAAALPALLGAYGFDRVVSSSSTRCVETVEPYTRAAALRLETSKHLSEEGYVADRGRTLARWDKALAEGLGWRTLVCSHGPVLPDLVERLAHRAPGAARELLEGAVADNLDKGELLTVHLLPGHDGARLVDAERHRP